MVLALKGMNIKTSIGQTLDLDDQKVMSKINQQLDNLTMELNKTAHQRFAETIEVEEKPKLPEDIFEENDETKKSKIKDEADKEEWSLDENVIE